MGCSASVPKSNNAAAATEVKVVRDDEDLELPPILLQQTNILEYDAVFEGLEAILAQVITWNNAINDYAVSVQNLLAPSLGALLPVAEVNKNVDILLLDLVTPFNKQRASPQHHVLLEWLKNKEIRDADSALAEARVSLLRYLTTSSLQVHLKLSDAPPGHVAMNVLEADVPESDQERILVFNSCVEQLQRAVGANFAVLPRLVPAAAPMRGKTAVMRVCKRRNKEIPDDDEPLNLAPATMVDIFNSGIADAVLKAERSVAVVGNELAKLVQKYDPPLSMVEEPRSVRKIKLLPVAKEFEEVNQTIRNVNAVLFKLAKACAKSAWIHSTPLSSPEVDFPDLPFMVCEALKRVADTTWNICKKQLDSIHLVALLTHHEPFTIVPIFEHTDSTFRFDLEVTVDQSLLIEKTFPDFLPAHVRVVWDALLALAAVVQESQNVLNPLMPDYERLHEEAREFASMAAEAAAKSGMRIGEATRAAKSTMSNLQAVFDAKATVFEVYETNVARIVAAYTKASREIKADLQRKLAELSSKLPRGLHKPTFSPELLAIAKQAVTPSELAATMTLALAAGSMDPHTKAAMQQQLAATGLATSTLAAPASPGHSPLKGVGLAAGLTSTWSNMTGYGSAPSWSQQQQAPGSPGSPGSPGAAAPPSPQQQMWTGAYNAAAASGFGHSGSTSPSSPNANAWAMAASAHSTYVPSRLGGAAAAPAARIPGIAAGSVSYPTAPGLSMTNSAAANGGMGMGWPALQATHSAGPSSPMR